MNYNKKEPSLREQIEKAMQDNGMIKEQVAWETPIGTFHYDAENNPELVKANRRQQATKPKNDFILHQDENHLLSLEPKYFNDSNVEEKQKLSKRTVYRSLTGFDRKNQRWLENNPQKDNINFIEDEYEPNQLVNDCLKSDRFNNFIINLKKPGREGIGYEDNPNKIDQPTNSGISEYWYKQFRANPKNAKIAESYPANLKFLTQEQIDNLYCQGFYKPLHNETYNDDLTSEHIFDIGVNLGGTVGSKIIQKAVNDTTNAGIAVGGGLGTQSVSAINDITKNDLPAFNNNIINRRQQYYKTRKDYDRFGTGWKNRSEYFRQ